MVYVCTSEKVDTQTPKAKITRVLGPTRENNKPRRPSYPSSFSPKTTLQFSRGCQVTSPFFFMLKSQPPAPNVTRVRGFCFTRRTASQNAESTSRKKTRFCCIYFYHARRL